MTGAGKTEYDEMGEKEYLLEHAPDCPVYCLFSGQSSHLNRRCEDQLLSPIIHHWVGGLGFWYGTGNGAHSYVPTPRWGCQGKILCEYHSPG